MIKTEKEVEIAFKKLHNALCDLEKPKKINIFDAAGMARQEVKHSAFLAWLFNPDQPHKKSGIFLSDFLKSLYSYSNNDPGFPSNAEILSKHFTLDELADFAFAKDITVDTEKIIDNPDSRIDIFIYSKEKNTVVVVENKTFTSTHDNQLHRYEEEVKKLDTDATLKKVFIYLTPFGKIPTDIEGNVEKNWCIIDYSTIIENLKLRVNKLTDPKLKYLTEDYINMVDNKILHNNPTVRELCKKIRREHSEAIERLLNYIDNVDMVYRYVATGWIPRNIPNVCNLVSGGRKLSFCTETVKKYYGKNSIDMNVGDGLLRFQIVVGSKDGPITIGMCLYKKAEDSWSVADMKIRDILQPNKKPGDKYCTLFSHTILTVEEREKVFETDDVLYELVDRRLQEFIVKLREFDKQLSEL